VSGGPSHLLLLGVDMLLVARARPSPVFVLSAELRDLARAPGDALAGAGV